MSRVIGPKEQQLRSLKASRPLTTPTAPAPAKSKPAPSGKKEPTMMDLNTPDTNANSTDTQAIPAATKKESGDMRTTKTKTKSKSKKAAKGNARKAVKAKTSAKKAAAKKPAGKGALREGSKLEIIVGLLKRKDGCTTRDVLDATGWPTVSMPQMAKAAGLKLTKEKEKGQPTRYRAA